MTFQNSNGHNLYWLSARTNKELHAWCLENGINLPKSTRKDVFIDALEKLIIKSGIHMTTHPDHKRATTGSSGCFTYNR